MSEGPDTALATERRLLRGRLQAQRLLVAERLASAPAPRNKFPRSLTMRLLTRHPALVRRVLLGVASGFLAVATARKRRSLPTKRAGALSGNAAADTRARSGKQS